MLPCLFSPFAEHYTTKPSSRRIERRAALVGIELALDAIHERRDSEQQGEAENEATRGREVVNRLSRTRIVRVEGGSTRRGCPAPSAETRVLHP